MGKRLVNRLTPLAIKRATKSGYYLDGNGLFLVVGKGTGAEVGGKSWVFRYKVQGKTTEMGLGSADIVTLSEARQKMTDARKLLLDGIDPLKHRQEVLRIRRHAEQSARTFEECARALIESKQSEWKNPKHRKQWVSTLETYAYPKIGSMDVADIDTAHVMRVLTPIWIQKNETASRLRGRIEAVLDWARVHEHRVGENPARWKGHLDKLLSAPGKVQRETSQHHAALAYSEIGAFLRDLRERDGMGARALEFAILTAARSGEVRGMLWSEVDLDAGIWTIPGIRMKAGKEHRVSLSDDAVKLLEALPRRNELVFPAPRGGPLSDMSLTAVLKRMGRADLTAHGFRSTFRDWSGEMSAHPREVIEHALAHQLADRVEAAYQRGDLFAKRKVLMADWAKYCSTIPQAADVLPMAGKRKTK
ncbi:tyrosine-type recombinase/integrase [Paraburkholderia saeva]|uniref:Prophage integrase IntA n=1 Tax=Paraburkholderia saeva TaxID=2777537 RepID=A0A9N8RTD5_9BURK|nr:site-specific integrase [Paraburkholderia saeva]CAG4889822.1 Prophage integrase IntA [Paraburkholderia saeva]